MDKDLSALDIANYLIQLASSKDENDLTNLKLQKLLYFAQGKYLAKFGKPLFEDKIEAWDLGPVVKNVYDTFKICGAFPITLFDVKYKSKPLDSETKKFLKSQIWSEYDKYSASHLVDLTHKQGTPWNEAYKAKERIIDEDKMKKFFSKAS